MKRQYETVVVFDGALPDNVLQQEQKQVESVFQQNAAFEKTDVWGKRALAYPIGKKRSGYYCLFLWEGEGNVITSLDKQFRLNDNVLRYMTVIRNVKNEAARAAAAARREKAIAEGELPAEDLPRRGHFRDRGGRYDRHDRFERRDEE